MEEIDVLKINGDDDDDDCKELEKREYISF